ncbi:MAG: hypothetical protein QM679_01105 [Patulibacter sp.]
MAAGDLDSDRVDAELDALLRAARPAPSLAWRAATRRALLPERAARRRFIPQMRPAAAWATAGLGAVVAAVALAGGGPLNSSDDAARATTGCHTVYVTKVAPVGELRRGADGVVRVETAQRPVVTAEQRCR